MNVLARHNVTILGEGGRTTLLVHGFGTDQRLWRHVAGPLSGRGRVVLFDHVGSGRSDMSAYTAERYGDLDGYAEDVLDVCAALDLRDVRLVGHSIGGMVGVRAAIAAPQRFAELVLIGSSARYLDDPPDYAGGFSRGDVDGLLDMMDRNYLDWARMLAPRVMGNADRPELSAELEETFCAADRGVARRFAAACFLSDSRGILGAVRTPALILQAERDIIVPPTAAAYLHRHLPGSTLVPLRASGHYPPLSAPEELVRIIEGRLGVAPAG